MRKKFKFSINWRWFIYGISYLSILPITNLLSIFYVMRIILLFDVFANKTIFSAAIGLTNDILSTTLNAMKSKATSKRY